MVYLKKVGVVLSSSTFELQKRGSKQLITQSVIDSIPCTKLFDFTPEMNEYVQLLHKELLTYAMKRNSSNEVGFLVDLTTWQVLRLVGDEMGISLAGFPAARHWLKEAFPGSLMFMHNHPNNSCFSYMDLNSFCSNYSLRLMTAIGNNGNIHVLAKGPGFCDTAVLFEYNKHAGGNKGMQYVLSHCTALGLRYKFGRCSK